MTTTDVYQGMDTGSKPSSRVLNPPGGSSSFSLFGGGGDEEPASRPGRRQAGQIQSQAPYAQDQSANPGMGVFGQEDQQTQPPHAGKRHVAHAESNNIFGGSNFPTDYSRKGPGQGQDTPPQPSKPSEEAEATPPGGVNARQEEDESDEEKEENGENQKVESNSEEKEQVKTTPETVHKPWIASGINPITGETLTPNQRDVHTSTRVRQPPGGASSGIF